MIPLDEFLMSPSTAEWMHISAKAKFDLKYSDIAACLQRTLGDNGSLIGDY